MTNFTSHPLPSVIGLSGYAQTGKDTTADYLVERYGFRRVAFADTLRDFVSGLYPDIADRVGREGWDAAKKQIEVRQALQNVGVAARTHIHPDVWIFPVLSHVEESGDPVVVTDVRFRNEADAIANLNGEIWRISRPGVGPVNNHISETDLDRYDRFSAVIRNDGDLETLHFHIDIALEEWAAHRMVGAQ